MHIVLGGTGHVGSALAAELLAAGEPVTIVARDLGKAAGLRERGARVALVDVRDVEGLRRVFDGGERLFLLNPPAAPNTDTDAEERETLAAILAALDGSAIRKVVAQSTYGARPGERCGDLGVLFEMERALAGRPVPVTIMRAAFLLSNWDPLVAPARETGRLTSLFPADFALPSVAPADLARTAARLMTEPLDRTGLLHVEGPSRPTPSEVAAALGRALGRPVAVDVVPPEGFYEHFRRLGFSHVAATSYAAMTAATLESGLPTPDEVVRGETTLDDYFSDAEERRSQPSSG